MIAYPLSISPQYKKVNGVRQRAGTYLKTQKMFPMTPTVAPVQFVGVHQWLCVTLFRPPEIETVLEISDQIPEIGGVKVVWLGRARCYPLQTDIRIYIPRHIWWPKETAFDKTWTTSSFVQAVKMRRGGVCYVLNVPFLTKDIIIGSQEKDESITSLSNTPSIPASIGVE